MTTIDTLMALADNYATLTADTAAVTSARETLRAALNEALVQQGISSNADSTYQTQDHEYFAQTHGKTLFDANDHTI